MTIGSLIFDVAANTVKLSKDVDLINGKMDAITGIAEKAKKALIAAFTITAIVKIGQQVITFASHLTDLSQKTGISTTGLQKLELAFAQSGISIDQVSKASEFLANVLVKGDKGPIALLQKLGLNADVLKNMSLDEMFITVGDAIGKMGNKAEQIYASKTLLGKGGVELLAGLTGNLKELTDGFADLGLIIDEKTIKSADEFGDKLGLLNRAGLVFTSEVLGPALPGLAKLAEWLSLLGKAFVTLEQVLVTKVINAWLRFKLVNQELVLSILEGVQKVPVLGKAFGIVDGAVAGFSAQVQRTKDQIKLFNIPIAETAVVAPKAGKAVQDLGIASADAATAAAKAEATYRSFRNEMAVLSMNSEALMLSVLKVEDAVVATAASFTGMRLPIATIDTSFLDLGETVIGTAKNLEGIGESAVDIGAVGVPAVDKMKQALLSMAQVAIAAGSALVGVLSNKAGFGSVATTAVSIGTGLAGAAIAASAWGASMTAAGVAGSIALGAATLGVGLAVVGVIALVKWLNNGRDKVRDMTAEVIRLNGGFDVLAFKIHAATGETVLFERLLAAGNEKEYETAIDAVSQALTALEERMTELRATAETTVDKMGALRSISPGLKIALEGVYNAKTPQEYADAIGRVNREVDITIGKQQALDASLGRLKTSWEILGPTARAQHLGQWATEVSDAIQTVVDHGADLNATIRQAGPELSEIVQAAKRSGTEIPAALRPVLQQAADLGVLFDASGQKIRSLEGYGVTFGSTFEQAMGEVRDAMQGVVDVLGDIRDAILGIPSQRLVTITVDTKLKGSGITLEDKAAMAVIAATTKPKPAGWSMHEGGPVLPHIPRAHNGLAIGEVPIIAQRGEVMFSRANVAAMGGVGATEAFRRGLGGGGRGSVVNISTARLEAQIEALRKQQTKADEQQAARDRNMPALFSLAARDAVQQQARRR